MKRLAIREPAAELLARSCRVLDEYLTPRTPDGEGWSIGGGTALAARWKHRWSKDLDIVVPIGTETARLSEEENPGFWNAMRAAGAAEIESELTLRFRFDGTRQVEILPDDRTPATGHETAELDCGSAVVRATILSPAQILRSKLHHRGWGAPVRDLYDVAVAYRLDRPALQIAVNSQPPRLIELAAATWRAQNEEYARRSTELRDIPPEHEHIRRNPGMHAADAVDAVAYRFMTIEARDGAIFTRAESDRFEQRMVYRSEQEARSGFEADGLNAALKVRGWNPKRILGEVTEALARNEHLETTPIKR